MIMIVKTPGSQMGSPAAAFCILMAEFHILCCKIAFESRLFWVTDATTSQKRQALGKTNSQVQKNKSLHIVAGEVRFGLLVYF